MALMSDQMGVQNFLKFAMTRPPWVGSIATSVALTPGPGTRILLLLLLLLLFYFNVYIALNLNLLNLFNRAGTDCK